MSATWGLGSDYLKIQLKKRDTGFENTHDNIVRLIRLSIETGCITGPHVHSTQEHIGCLTKCSRTLALSAAALLILVYLPGHPPYFATAAFIAAKLYSNSMMAMLNSRVKAVSNAPSVRAPIWNESLKTIGPISSTERAQSMVFRRDSEPDFSQTSALLGSRALRRQQTREF